MPATPTATLDNEDTYVTSLKQRFSLAQPSDGYTSAVGSVLGLIAGPRSADETSSVLIVRRLTSRRWLSDERVMVLAARHIANGQQIGILDAPVNGMSNLAAEGIEVMELPPPGTVAGQSPEDQPSGVWDSMRGCTGIGTDTGKHHLRCVCAASMWRRCRNGIVDSDPVATFFVRLPDDGWCVPVVDATAAAVTAA